jgi:serine/threonine protein kinase
MKFGPFKRTAPHANPRLNVGEADSSSVSDATNPQILVTAESEVSPASHAMEQDFGEYELLNLIGQGGVGEVYRAKHKLLGKVFAIKVFHSELLGDSALKEFEQQAKAASDLTHENLVAIYGQGILANGDPYIIMDFIDGVSLRETIRSHGFLNISRVLDIAAQLCEAFIYARSKGIVLRDVNPNSILITKNNIDAEIVKVVGFDIAQTLGRTTDDGRLNRAGELFRSPSYLSPEQAMGLPLDERTDVYSLGCLMFEALVGKPPLQAENPFQLSFKPVDSKTPNVVLRHSNRKLVNGMQSIVAHALRKGPADRYQTVSELKRDLDRVASCDQPFLAQSKGWASLVNKLLVSGSILLGVCMLFVLWQTWMYRYFETDRAFPASVVLINNPPSVSEIPTGSAAVKQQIKDRYGRILYSSNAADLPSAVNEALRKGVNLAGADIYNLTISVPEINNARLQGARFKSCKIDDLTFSNSNLTGTDFEDCSMFNVHFKDCSMSSSSFKNSKLVMISFDESNLKNAKFDNCKAGLNSIKYGQDGVSFKTSKLNGAQFIGGVWTNCKFLSSMPDVVATFKLTSSTISCISLGHADFSGAVIVSSKISAADVHLAKFGDLRDTKVTQQVLKER